MTFLEIFDTDGLYIADGFADGICLKVDGGVLLFVTYSSEDDMNPEVVNALMYKNLLTKDYKKVFTRQSLFNKEV